MLCFPAFRSQVFIHLSFRSAFYFLWGHGHVYVYVLDLDFWWLNKVVKFLGLWLKEEQKRGYGVELLEVQSRMLLGGLSCLAMDPTVLPITVFCGSLVASISGELHLPLSYYPSLD